MTAARLARAALVASIAVIWVAVVAFARGHWGALYDDAFIYLRYVSNLRAGCGLSFNCGDPPVEGFTGPLFLGLLYLGSFFTDKLVSLTGIICSASLGGALSVAALAAAHRSFDPGGRSAVVLAPMVVACVFAFDHFVLLNGVVGFEAPVAALAVTGLFLSVLAESRVATAGLAVLATLCRPECALFVVLLPLLPFMRRTRPWVAIVASLVLIELTRWTTFHDVVPNTYWAKSGGTMRHAQLGATYVAQVFRDFPVIGLAPLSLLIPGARRVATYLLLVTALWLAFFLCTGGDTFEYSRLAVPLVPALSVLGVHGLGALARRWGGALAVRVEAIALGSALALFVVQARTHWQKPVHAFANVSSWGMVGRYLRARHPGETVATVPIGAIAYYSHLRVIDLVGLTTPAIAKAGRGVPPGLLEKKWIGHERHNTEWVASQKPDLVITTKWSPTPYTSLAQASTGFYADWLLLRAIKAGSLPYHVYDAEIAPHLHWLMFQRDPAPERQATPGP